MRRLLIFTLPLTAQGAEPTAHSGSGYAAVEGSVVNYTYNNFSILPNGERRESIFVLTCFDARDKC